MTGRCIISAQKTQTGSASGDLSEFVKIFIHSFAKSLQSSLWFDYVELVLRKS